MGASVSSDTSSRATVELITQQHAQAFFDRDLAAIAASEEAAIASAPEVFEVLLFAHTERWVAPLTAEIDRGGAFIAVGLGYVIGDRGLLALQTARGYEVSRIAR